MPQNRNAVSSVLQSAPNSLWVFDSHPIQYRSPYFRILAQRLPGFRVFFFDSSFDGRRWWFREFGKSPKKEPFGVPLQTGFQNETLEARQIGWWAFFRRVQAKLRADRPQSVLLFGYYLVENWIVWFLARRYGARVLFIGETFEMGRSGLTASLKKMVLRLFFSGVDKVISTGSKSEGYYHELGVSTEQIQSARYCVDNAFFASTESEIKQARAAVRTRLHIAQDALVILFVGRLFSRKRPLDVVELQRRVGSLGVQTIMAGAGEMAEAVGAAAQAVGGIHLLGFQDQRQLVELYKACDLLYVPSEFETWGLVVNEACASGMTALVTDTCGVAQDLIVEGQTGFVNKVGDLDRAQAVVEACVKDPALLRSRQRAACARVLKDYGIDQFALAIETAATKTTA